MAVIKAKHYGETEARLAKDPIVKEMAKGLAGVPMDEMVHEDGETPRFEFMQAANAEYRERGGEDGGHIGAVANALLKVLAEEPKTKVVQYFASRDVPSASGDEDRAMTSASIYSGKDFGEAKKALIDYMVHSEAAGLAKYDATWALSRTSAIMDGVQDLMRAEFPGKEGREVIEVMADGIRFQLVRTERDA